MSIVSSQQYRLVPGEIWTNVHLITNAVPGWRKPFVIQCSRWNRPWLVAGMPETERDMISTLAGFDPTDPTRPARFSVKHQMQCWLCAVHACVYFFLQDQMLCMVVKHFSCYQGRSVLRSLGRMRPLAVRYSARACRLVAFVGTTEQLALFIF